MKFKTLILGSLVAVTLLSSCNAEVDILGNWAIRAYFGGRPRTEGTSFSINNIGYFGLGKDDDQYLSDFWKYDPANNTWTQLSNFPGTPRAFNVSTCTATKGYMGLGYNGKSDMNDLWEYDPGTDTWTEVAEFPGVKRREAVAFAIGDNVYVGTGTSEDGDIDHNDFYKYSNGQWSTITSFTGRPRRSSVAVTMDGKGYVISGTDRSGISIDDMWSYNPETNLWESYDQLTDKETGVEGSLIQRYNASAFAVDSRIYLVAGINSGSARNTCYEWNLSTKNWTEKTSLEASPRSGQNIFVLNGSGYVLCGSLSNNFFTDLWKFEPFEEDEDDDNN